MRLALLTLLSVAAVPAAELTGYISDAACGWNNAQGTKESKECALKCVKAGWAPVFVPDGSMNAYTVLEPAKVMEFVGDRVVLNGTLKKDAVTVVSVRKAGPAKPSASRK